MKAQGGCREHRTQGFGGTQDTGGGGCGDMQLRTEYWKSLGNDSRPRQYRTDSVLGCVTVAGQAGRV